MEVVHEGRGIRVRRLEVRVVFCLEIFSGEARFRPLLVPVFNTEGLNGVIHYAYVVPKNDIRKGRSEGIGTFIKILVLKVWPKRGFQSDRLFRVGVKQDVIAIFWSCTNRPICQKRSTEIPRFIFI